MADEEGRLSFVAGMDDSDCEGSGDVKPDGIVSKSEGRPSLMKAVEAILG